MRLKPAGWVANSLDTDQTPRAVTSDLVWSIRLDLLVTKRKMNFKEKVRSTNVWRRLETFMHFEDVYYNLHYENMPIQIYWKFYHRKMKNFR